MWEVGYDEVDRLRSVVVRQAGVAEAVASYFYGYDAGDNRVSRQEGLGVESGVYNEVNQLVQSGGGGGPVQVRGTVNEAAEVEVDGARVRWRGTNEFEAEVYVGGAGTNGFGVRAQDGSGNAVTNQYRMVTTAGGAETFIYDANGCLTEQRGAGVTNRYEWDAMDRLVAVENLAGAGLERTEFTYDGLSRRVRQRELLNGAVLSEKVLLWYRGSAQPCEQRSSGRSGVRKGVVFAGDDGTFRQ